MKCKPFPRTGPSNTENTEFGLPSSGGSVRVKRYESSTVSSAQWKGSAQYLVSEAHEALQIQCRLRLTATDYGRTSKIKLNLSVLADLLRLESKGLVGTHSPEMTDDAQEIQLAWEDELSIRDSIVYALESEGFCVDCSTTGSEALDMAAANKYQLIVLDVGLPDLNGFDVCQQLRKTNQVPVIFLTAHSSEVDRVVGLEIGADDYVTKPFSPRELSARVRTNVRRSLLNHSSNEPPASPASPNAPPFRIDYESWVVSYFGKPLSLSRYEFRLLAVLIEKPGRVFSSRNGNQQFASKCDRLFISR